MEVECECECWKCVVWKELGRQAKEEKKEWDLLIKNVNATQMKIQCSAAATAAVAVESTLTFTFSSSMQMYYRVCVYVVYYAASTLSLNALYMSFLCCAK